MKALLVVTGARASTEAWTGAGDATVEMGAEERKGDVVPIWSKRDERDSSILSKRDVSVVAVWGGCIGRGDCTGGSGCIESGGCAERGG